MMKGIAKAMQENSFNYWRFIIGKIARLWPMVLLWTAIALGTGLFVMLPDDLENLSESVIASNVFANNILACITTRNYWDVANVFKPLMHTWYVGVLMQAYVILPLIYAGVFKLAKRNMNAVKISVMAVTVLSLAVYILPMASTAEKFYYLPFRVFEITLGSLIAFAKSRKIAKKTQYAVEAICLATILLLICVNIEIPAASLKLLLVVCATAILTYVFAHTEEKPNWFVRALSGVGKASLSIYLCHQVIIAYMFYAVTERTDLIALLLFSAVVAGISALFYFGVERQIGRTVKKNVLIVLIPSVVLCLLTSVVSGVLYLHAGVIRDVPELGIDKTNVHRGMHAEYCDVPYSWDRDFESTDKVKVVVIGDSFGRDFANVLNESDIAEQIEISYIYPRTKDVYDDYKERLSEADVVFRTFSVSKVDIEENLPDIVPDDKMYIVGYKNFGTSNGMIYVHRGSDDYFDQSVTLSDEVFENDKALSEQYGDHYIDMIKPVQNEDGSIRVFTDDQHFISQDCRHLTQYGAKYYAKILDLEWITDMKK